ncbi:MAG: hypothetical protein IJG33_01040 [Selenomonadaceae bacterium]|nr:hypothetical protein [Selenomonadaceae bacterium]
MIDLTTPIIPYVGTGIFKLDASYDEIKAQLEAENISYKEEIWEATDVDPPWTVIGISKVGEKDDAISITFAKNRLFRICLYEDFDGKLPNGIHTGMAIEEALEIDKKLSYNDDNDELYESLDGYWLDYHRGTRKILTILIFIPAFERDDFFDYKW